MRPRCQFLLLSCFAIGLASCSAEPTQNSEQGAQPIAQQPPSEQTVEQMASTPPEPSTSTIPQVPVEYSLSVNPVLLPNGKVRLEIRSNIPGAVEVMAGLSLQGQADNDVFIGKNERVRLSDGQGTVTFTVSDLPKGEYDAEASFYPRWGFQDSASRATGISKNLDASSSITLEGSGEAAADAQTKENGQRWIMENVAMGDRWRPTEWIQRFGEYQELRVDRGNPEILKAYYFPRIDTTLIVNTLKNEITVWRLGKAHS